MGIFADENKALDVQLTKLELQNDKGETITETSIGSSFKLFANYTINDTIHTGDYFDMVVPEQIDLSSAFTDYNFTLNDSEGEAIAHAVVKPSETGGGIIHIIFNEKMNGKANLQGNLFFYAKGNEKAVKLGEATPIRVVLNNNNKNSYNVSPPVTFDEVYTVSVTSNGGVLTIKNTKEKKEEPKKPEEPSKPAEPNKPEQPETPNKPEEPSKPEPKKPDVPNVEQPKKPEEPKKDTPKVEEPKKDTPEIKKPEPPKPVEHSTSVLPNVGKNSTQKEQAQQVVKKDVPNTGDNNDIVFYSMLLMFTTAMIVRFKKKNN